MPDDKSLRDSGISLLESEAKEWRINLDSLTDADLSHLARLAAEQVGHFGHVEGVPPHGLRFAEALRRHATRGPLLIVDDVLATGETIEAQREGRDAIGVVIFAMGPCPEWVKPVFTLGKLADRAESSLEDLKKRLFYWAPSRAPDAMAAIDALGSERNSLLLSVEEAELKAQLVDDAALLFREWVRLAQGGAELPVGARYWLARYEALEGHGGC
jgi:hypothetical protein